MTYSSGGGGGGIAHNNYSDNNISCSLGQGINNNVNVNSGMNVNQNVQRMISQAHTIDQPQQFAHFINSPSRLATTTTTNRAGSDEFSLYTPPAVSISDASIYQQQQQLVQRRSHSTPRTDSNSTLAIMAQRPRSLDRNTINALAMSNSRPPPIPPSRRFSQQPLSSSSLINSNPASCSLSLIKNSPNSVQYPAITSSPSSTMTAATSTTHQQQRSHAVASGMRQSITFHGQLSRHTANSPSYSGGGSSFGDAVTKNEADILSRPGARRKVDRPVSFAYGTLRDQTFLENQLRIYSEQLRTITESVRKYSEQAKILSEMKRQQQQQQQQHQMKGHLESPQKRSNLIQSDSNIYKGQASAAEPETPSHQLRAFLDSIRNTMKDPNTESADGAAAMPCASTIVPPIAKTENNVASKPVEAKTPSDQLRQFLDAIRSNQLPPDEQPDDLASAATRFSKFKEKMEHSRSKSTPNFDKYKTSSNVSETFTQVSDNLRIMNEDLAALAAASPNKKPSIANYKLHLTNTASPATPTTANPMPLQLTIGQPRKYAAGSGGTVDSVLDSFSRLAQNAHSIDTVDYLRKCSEALRHTSNQLRVATMHNNAFTDSGDSSSCSTTPGSIREAVQNLMQQPRNGVQIMDDRMKLFIDILDSQSKFSQVKKRTQFLGP